MQQNYRYQLVARVGRGFHNGFVPELTPSEMLRLGVFGGKHMTDCRSEFPASWFAEAKLASGPTDPAINCFGVLASQKLSDWRQAHDHIQRGSKLAI